MTINSHSHTLAHSYLFYVIYHIVIAIFYELILLAVASVDRLGPPNIELYLVLSISERQELQTCASVCSKSKKKQFKNFNLLQIVIFYTLLSIHQKCY